MVVGEPTPEMVLVRAPRQSSLLNGFLGARVRGLDGLQPGTPVLFALGGAQMDQITC